MFVNELVGGLQHIGIERASKSLVAGHHHEVTRFSSRATSSECLASPVSGS